MQPEFELNEEKTSRLWGAPEVIYGILAMILLSGGMLLAVNYWGVKSNAILVLYELAYLLPVVVLLLLKKIPLAELGLRKFAFSELLVGVSLLFLAYLVILLHNLTLVFFGIAPQGEYIAEVFNMDVNIWVLGLAIVVIAPLAEEIFFRSFVYAGLEAHFGWQKAVLISALLFGVAHMQLVAFIPTTLMGLVLAYLYHRSRSVWPSIILHATVNGFGFTMIYLLINFSEQLSL
jgi:membrane protease YdiL (CAAX protease family)